MSCSYGRQGRTSCTGHPTRVPFCMLSAIAGRLICRDASWNHNADGLLQTNQYLLYQLHSLFSSNIERLNA